MKVLLQNIKDEFDILVPFVDGDILEQEYEMGLFHDRFIASSSKNKDEIRAIFDKKLELTYKSFDKKDYKLLEQNMTNHFIIASQDELKQIDKNLVFALNKILDSLELKREIKIDKEKNIIQQYQEKHIQNSKVKSIEQLSQKLGFDYYAVITADGDKMGQKIKNEATEDITKIKVLSQKLFEFFTKDKDIYTLTNKEFKGELIYAGGDDILALLPVKNGDKIFLDYIERLSKRFQDIVGNDVSLSFGVNIAYYKYPLRDAVQSSFDLLYQAKDKAPNSIALKITKHSGQTFSSILQLNSDIYNTYSKLLKDVLLQEVELPHSIHHSLKRYQQPIIQSFKNEFSSIDALFDTIFNDEKNDKTENGLKALKEYIKSYDIQDKQDFDAIFAQLSLIKFLREDRKDD